MSQAPLNKPRLHRVPIQTDSPSEDVAGEDTGSEETVGENITNDSLPEPATTTAANRGRVHRVPIERYSPGQVGTLVSTHERTDVGPIRAQSKAREWDERPRARERDWDEPLRRARPGRAPRPRFLPLVLGGVVGVVIGGLLLTVFLLNSKVRLPFLSAASTPTQAPRNIAPSDLSNANSNPISTATPAKPQPPTVDLKAPPAGLFDLGPAGVNRGQLNLPRGIAQDANGNFFVADTQNFRIQKFGKDGKFITMFGSKGEGDGQFSPISEEGVGTGPGGVAVDRVGNVYVADTWNHRVQKFDNNGKFLAKWGAFISLSDADSAADADKNSKFWGPRGVAIGPDGNIYVTDTGNKRVLIFDAKGKFRRKIDSGMSPTQVWPAYKFDKPGELNEPIGIVVDGGGNVYVADTNNQRIQKFDKNGKPVAQWAIPAGNWAPGPYLEPFLAMDSTGNIYITAPTGDNLLKFSPTGKLLSQKNKQGAVTLKTPTGIMVGTDATVYVVDTEANAVVNMGKIIP